MPNYIAITISYIPPMSYFPLIFLLFFCSLMAQNTVHGTSCIISSVKTKLMKWHAVYECLCYIVFFFNFQDTTIFLSLKLHNMTRDLQMLPYFSLISIVADYYVILSLSAAVWSCSWRKTLAWSRNAKYKYKIGAKIFESWVYLDSGFIVFLTIHASCFFIFIF